ncbi:MAG: hypothetical protein ACTHMC_09510 [Pseudobacter sp.]|uniref:hypothetical protein n=1 Tax=Pseudobacter sp. TaxID=2045420 RepID=UPI003F81A14D
MVTGEENFFDPDALYERLMNHAKSLIGRKLTREQALQELIDAGIMDKDGNYTEPYKALQEYTLTAP